jgi:hypothetical protein
MRGLVSARTRPYLNGSRLKDGASWVIEARRANMRNQWLALCIFGAGCAVSPATVPGYAIEAASTCSGRAHFAGKLDANKEDNGAKQAIAFERILVAAKEPPLSCGSVPETYRLIRLPAMGGHALIVRASARADGGADLIVTTQADQYRSKSGTHDLTPDQWLAVQKAAADLDFWEERVWALPASSQTIVFDGSAWILEGRKDNYYHVIVRSAGSRSAPATLRQFASTLFEIAKLPPDGDMGH